MTICVLTTVCLFRTFPLSHPCPPCSCTPSSSRIPEEYGSLIQLSADSTRGDYHECIISHCLHCPFPCLHVFVVVLLLLVLYDSNTTCLVCCSWMRGRRRKERLIALSCEFCVHSRRISCSVFMSLAVFAASLSLSLSLWAVILV